MAVSNKKKRQLKRGYPKKSITELASELGLKEAQVREALEELGLLAETRTRLRPDAGLGGKFGFRIMLPVFLAMLTAGIYLPTLKNDFVVDDPIIILQNPLVTGQENIFSAFTARFWEAHRHKGVYYRPIITLSYRLDYKFWKAKAAGYHLTNLVLHALVAVLAFMAFKAWSQSAKLGIIAGLLFAAHPAHTQSVSWIAGRTDVIATLFCLLTLLFYLQSREQTGAGHGLLVALSLLSFATALWAKESAIIFPGLILAGEWLRPGAKRLSLDRERLVFYGGLAGIAMLYLAARSRVLGFALGYAQLVRHEWYPAGQTDFSRLATVDKIFFYYLKTLLYPVKLCFECQLAPSLSAADLQVPISAAALLLALALGVYAGRRVPEISLGMLWFFAGLLPVANIFPMQEIAMEHFLYLPSLGLGLVLAGIVVRLDDYFSGRQARAGRVLVLASLGLILAFYSTLTVARNRVWKDEATLWKDAAQKTPSKWRPEFNMGKFLFNRGQPKAALRYWRRALMGDPKDEWLYYDMGVAWTEVGDLDRAIPSYREALRLKPQFMEAHNNLGRALEEKGDLAGALQEYQKAYSVDKDFIVPLNNMIRLYAQSGRCAEARAVAAQSGNKASKEALKMLEEKCPGQAAPP